MIIKLFEKRDLNADELIARLKELVSRGAPSEQESHIRYEAHIWSGIHNIIDDYEKTKQNSKAKPGNRFSLSRFLLGLQQEDEGSHQQAGLRDDRGNSFK